MITYEVARGLPIGYIDIHDDGEVVFSNLGVERMISRMSEVYEEPVGVAFLDRIETVLGGSWTVRVLSPAERLLI